MKFLSIFTQVENPTPLLPVEQAAFTKSVFLSIREYKINSGYSACMSSIHKISHRINNQIPIKQILNDIFSMATGKRCVYLSTNLLVKSLYLWGSQVLLVFEEASSGCIQQL